MSLHILTVLAVNQPDIVNSEVLARGIKTNPSFIRKLIVSLTAAGLIESVRGKFGGARLVKSPQEITLDQVYRAIGDCNLMAVPDKTPNKSCDVSCAMGDILCKLSAEIQSSTLRTLSKRSLKDLVDSVKA